jgi:hypothetical protein
MTERLTIEEQHYCVCAWCGSFDCGCDFSCCGEEGKEISALRDEQELNRELVRWLYWRVAHYSQGLVDLEDVETLDKIKKLEWLFPLNSCQYCGSTKGCECPSDAYS